MKKILTSQKTSFSQWYQDIITKAELISHTQSKGTIIFDHNAYIIWEQMQSILNELIKAEDIKNIYMPMLIPEILFQKESEHIEGFKKESYTITKIGDKLLQNNLIIRPTSEPIATLYLKNKIQSYKELPLSINQWCNVLRYEMRPRAFIRTTEFLWQEIHSAHISNFESNKFAINILNNIYALFLEKYMAIKPLTGYKTDIEKFPGAETTYTCEGIIPNLRTLQLATTHNLNNKFAQAFNGTFLNKDHKEEHFFQASCGISTRLLGALIMIHGDDYGLRVPPKIAPKQVVIVPLSNETNIINTVEDISNQLTQNNIRIHVDTKYHLSPGNRFISWELQGVPIRLDIGINEVKSQLITCNRRILQKKENIPLNNLCSYIIESLKNDQEYLYDQSSTIHNKIINIESIEDIKNNNNNEIYKIKYNKIQQYEDNKLKDIEYSVRCILDNNECIISKSY